MSLPLAIVGALLALLITDRTLSLSAMMGFLLLVGIVVTNAIVLLTFVEQLRERGYDTFDALVEGGRVRLRPILMTAFTTTFALLPLAASETDSGIIGAELATVVIGGLVSSTFLTLIVVPAVYWIFNVSIPNGYARLTNLFRRNPSPGPLQRIKWQGLVSAKMDRTEKASIEFNGKLIGYTIIRSARRKKTVEITLDPQQGVVVRSPARTPRREITALVQKRAEWILSHATEDILRLHRAASPTSRPCSTWAGKSP